MKDDIDFASCMETVARDLLGEPDRSLSNRSEWRYGTNGSLSVNLKSGTWFDHENQESGRRPRSNPVQEGPRGP